MANFDLTTYPLAQETVFTDDLTVARDLMDDGTMQVRVLGDSTYRTFTCTFQHMSEQTSADFAAYLITNRATELDFVFSGVSPNETYRGYVWGTPSYSVTEGIWHIWTLQFRGKKV